MLAAEAVVKALEQGKEELLLEYEKALARSYVARELWEVRNVRPAFKYGFWPGLLLSGLSTIVFRGNEPWTLKHHEQPDYATLKPIESAKKIDYPKPDGKIAFDLLESVSRTGTNHEEDQPSHLKLKKGPSEQLGTSLLKYGGPEQKFCPAGVYEYVTEESTSLAGSETKFVINAQNCIHCKTCDIKDPTQNIDWTVPEGGGGPSYQGT